MFPQRRSFLSSAATVSRVPIRKKHIHAAYTRLLILIAVYVVTVSVSIAFLRTTIHRPGALAFVAGILFYYGSSILSFALPWIAAAIGGLARFKDCKEASLPYNKSLLIAIATAAFHFTAAAFLVFLFYYFWYPK
jgi:hypothetical protein